MDRRFAVQQFPSEVVVFEFSTGAHPDFASAWEKAKGLAGWPTHEIPRTAIKERPELAESRAEKNHSPRPAERPGFCLECHRYRHLTGHEKLCAECRRQGERPN